MGPESMSKLQMAAFGRVVYFVIFKSDNPAPRPKLWVCLGFDHQNGELVKQGNSDYFLLTIWVPPRYKAFGSRKPVHTYICLHMHALTGLLLCWVQQPILELCAICMCISKPDENFFPETTELLPIIAHQSMFHYLGSILPTALLRSFYSIPPTAI